MLTMYSRRAGRVVTGDTNPHARYYRDCANDDPRDQFAVARCIINALCIGGGLLGVAVALWVGAVVLMGW